MPEISLAAIPNENIVIYHDMKIELSRQQKRILEAVAWFEDRQESALVPGLLARLKLAAESSLTPTLRILERKGMVKIFGGGAQGRPRVIRLTEQGRRAMGRGGIPILGSIPAGPLAEALSDPDEFVDQSVMLPWRKGDFLLRVKGDSMIGDGILDGDKVLLRPDVDCQPGEIAAVLVGAAHEATLKHVIPMPKEGKVRLRASNPGYCDLIAPVEEVKIAGVFRGLIRDVSRP